MECFAKKSFSFLQDSAHLLEYDKSIYISHDVLNTYVILIFTGKVFSPKIYLLVIVKFIKN